MPASNTGFDLDAWLSGLLNDLIPALSQLAGSANDQAVEKVVNLALGEEQPKNLYATYPKFGMTNLRAYPRNPKVTA